MTVTCDIRCSVFHGLDVQLPSGAGFARGFALLKPAGVEGIVLGPFRHGLQFRRLRLGERIGLLDGLQDVLSGEVAVVVEGGEEPADYGLFQFSAAEDRKSTRLNSS